jgi:hypothetical protein
VKNKHLYIILACGLLLLVYAVSASLLYRSAIESDLHARAQDLLASSNGLENVAVAFTNLDARLSGTVTNPQLKSKAERLVAGLPAVRVVASTITFPPKEFTTPPDIAKAATPSDPPPPPEPPQPPPPKPKPSTVTLVSNDDEVVLTGTVTSVARKKKLLKPFALTGLLFELDTSRLKIDPEITPDDWPEDLAPYFALVATRSRNSRLILTNTKFDLMASALDERAAAQIRQATKALALPGRKQSVEINAQPLPPLPDEGFFFRALMNAQGNRLTLEGRLGSHQEKDQLIEIIRTDLPGIDFAEQIEVAGGSDWSAPEYAPRLSNMLSLVYTRAATANVIAEPDGIYLVGEMKPGLSPDDVTDLLRIMLGIDQNLQSDLLPHASDFIPVSRRLPTKPAESRDKEASARNPSGTATTDPASETIEPSPPPHEGPPYHDRER